MIDREGERERGRERERERFKNASNGVEILKKLKTTTKYDRWWNKNGKVGAFMFLLICFIVSFQRLQYM